MHLKLAMIDNRIVWYSAGLDISWSTLIIYQLTVKNLSRQNLHMKHTQHSIMDIYHSQYLALL